MQCCPMLRYWAEIQRLAEVGLTTESYNVADAIVIGRLRQEHGCPGPRFNYCPWQGAAGSAAVRVDPKVSIPSLARRSDDGRKVPGQML